MQKSFYRALLTGKISLVKKAYMAAEADISQKVLYSIAVGDSKSVRMLLENPFSEGDIAIKIAAIFGRHQILPLLCGKIKISVVAASDAVKLAIINNKIASVGYLLCHMRISETVLYESLIMAASLGNLRVAELLIICLNHPNYYRKHKLTEYIKLALYSCIHENHIPVINYLITLPESKLFISDPGSLAFIITHGSQTALRWLVHKFKITIEDVVVAVKTGNIEIVRTICNSYNGSLLIARDIADEHGYLEIKKYLNKIK